MAKGCAYAVMNSQRPSADELVELLVGEAPHERLVLLEPLRRESRISSARSRVWSGGSIVTMCSNIGIWSRCCSTSSLTSSPSRGTGNGAKGPTTELQDENASVLR